MTGGLGGRQPGGQDRRPEGAWKDRVTGGEVEGWREKFLPGGNALDLALYSSMNRILRFGPSPLGPATGSRDSVSLRLAFCPLGLHQGGKLCRSAKCVT